ncbi:hypothetical protein ORI89_16005 [Sphingobacterium sp. UT-1RO-CII-1]|uniref:hypothetical protein n=1 Tax=Sphingobacterium sp. UT-1RO-CII-1 TaxID=2995225 RepID=UPI00227A5710|nr:hypothetical protein [Sphingobacterium sp. UT-1RO-CII-1]MCY4781166.1 hypothetical protein [Sphingobacterium sp. UT-1RO-CII-1]
METKISYKHLIYLRKKDLKNFRRTIEMNIDTVFGNIQNIQEDIYKMLLIISTEKRLNIDTSTFSWSIKIMKTYVEIAYITLIALDLKPYKNPFKKLKIESMLFSEREYFEGQEGLNFLRIFFGLKTIGRWNMLIDEIFALSIDKSHVENLIDSHDLIIEKDFLLKLPFTLYALNKDKTISCIDLHPSLYSRN